MLINQRIHTHTHIDSRTHLKIVHYELNVCARIIISVCVYKVLNIIALKNKAKCQNLCFVLFNTLRLRLPVHLTITFTNKPKNTNAPSFAMVVFLYFFNYTHLSKNLCKKNCVVVKLFSIKRNEQHQQHQQQHHHHHHQRYHRHQNLHQKMAKKTKKHRKIQIK